MSSTTINPFAELALERHITRKAIIGYLEDEYSHFLSENERRLDTRARKDVTQRYLQMTEQIINRYDQCVTGEDLVDVTIKMRDKINTLFERLTAKYGA